MVEEVLSMLLFNGLTIALLIIALIANGKNTNYLTILVMAILWGLVPWPFYHLTTGITSIFTIVFLRLLIATIGGVLFILISLMLRAYFKRKAEWNWFQYSVQDLKIQVTNSLPISTLKTEAMEKQRKIPYLVYYFALGFLYFISILFYFYSYQNLSVIFTAIINMVATTILIAFWNLLRKQEFVNSLKITYLLLLLVAGILTIQSLIITELTGSLFFGLISLLTTILAWVVFIILSGWDDFTQAEKNRVLSFNDRPTNFQLSRSMVKLTFFFFFSILSLVLFAVIVNAFPIAGSTIKDQITLFFSELQQLPALLTNPWAWFLGIEVTIFPYLLYFLSQNNWSSRALRWDQWVAILAAFEPLTSIFVGIFVGNEAYKYNLLLLILATIVIALTMLLRYYHEKNCLKSIIFLRIKQGRIKGLINRLKYNPNVVEIKTITGQYDVVLRTLFQSNHLLKTFIEKLKDLDDTLGVQYFVEFELKR
jgi:hypothetical protein